MPVHNLISRHSKSTHKGRHAPEGSVSSPETVGPSSAHSIQRDTDGHDILQLQAIIGNHATLQRLTATREQPLTPSKVSDTLQREPATAPIAVHHTTPHIQRTPLSDKEAELAEAELAREKTKSGTKARTRINQKITKLKQEIEALKGSSNGSGKTVEPPKPKTAAEEFPALKTAFSDEEITKLRDQLTAEKLKEVAAVYLPADLKTNVDTLTLPKFKELLGVFTAQEVWNFGSELTVAKLKDVLAKFTTSDFKTNIDKLTLVKFKALLAQFTIDQVWDFGAQITVEKLKQLVTVWPVSEIKAMFNSLGMVILKDLMSQFTGSELKIFVTTVGIDRFQILVKTKKIKATGLKKYGAAWLKTFVGAGPTTMNHLLTVYTKSNGVISGGHDAAVFYPELNRIINTVTYEGDDGNDYDEDIPNGRVTSTQVKTNYDKVIYATHYMDGSTKNTGAKSLIHNLSTQQALWLRRANEAIWAAIAAETFGDGAWAGTSADGIAFNGFYNSPATQVDTFFPVN